MNLNRELFASEEVFDQQIKRRACMLKPYLADAIAAAHCKRRRKLSAAPRLDNLLADEKVSGLHHCARSPSIRRSYCLPRPSSPSKSAISRFKASYSSSLRARKRPVIAAFSARPFGV